MSGVRIYDLAKELKLTNGDVMDLLSELGEPAKTASSTISDAAAAGVRKAAAEKQSVKPNGVHTVSQRNGSATREREGAPARLPATQPNANKGERGASTEGKPNTGASPRSSAPAQAQKAPAQPQTPKNTQPGPQGARPAPKPMAGKPDGGAPKKPAGDEPTAAAVSGPVSVPSIVSLKDFADLIGVPAPSIQKKLMGLGVLASLNQKLSPEVVMRLAKSYGVIVDIVDPTKTAAPAVAPTPKPEETKVAVVAAKPRQKPAGPVTRPPVVTIMGHVDHGKTSLLDAIRKSKVVATEHGGITQHIGAYQVDIVDPSTQQSRKITFLDTPGHAAFTAMRARGAQVTDIAVLVVAADDGIMPQTIEAIDHARAAGVPIIVAVNKIDKEDANPTRVLTQLTEHNVMPELYGGDVQTVELSAKEKLGLDDLLEKILLVADVEVEPKADPTAPAVATVIEAELDRGRGVVATILVEQGTVRMGDVVTAGTSFGKIKAMIDDRGQRVTQMLPGGPVVILGLNSVPMAGDRLEVVKDEKTARQLADERIATERQEKLTTRRVVTLEDIQRQIKEGDVKTLNLIIKGDVQGSVEAIRQSLEKIEHPEVKVKFISTNVGGVSDSDIQLASASNAIVVAFNVRVDPTAARLAEAEHIEIREYKVIYDLFDDVKKAMAGLLDPIYEEAALGIAEVRAVFKLPRAGGVIAGSYINDGKVVRGANVRIRRNNKIVGEGKIDTLKREKDDVREVNAGYECGILIPGYDAVEGDKIECYEMRRIDRTL